MNARAHPGWLAIPLLALQTVAIPAAEPAALQTNTIRVAAAQAAPRVVDFQLPPEAALAAVEENLAHLERIVTRAGEAGCDALVLPEDTAGLLNWLGANEASAAEVLPAAVRRMIDRLGAVAARHDLYLVVCSDFIERDGGIYNTAFLLGRDGREIGRYHKVCPTWGEAGLRRRGDAFPVFPTPDLGTVGMLICYDLVMPETARSLALQGADIILFPTMGGAAIGDEDIGIQALRVRAVENFTWLAVAQRGEGAMIISPQGEIVARAEGPDGLAIADILPHGQREGGDALNWQRDMRARLFRERHPAAFGLLTDTNPPVLAKVPIGLSSQEAGRIMARTLTVGDEAFKRAADLASSGRTPEAIGAFEQLRREYPDTWIDRVARTRLAQLQPAPPTDAARWAHPAAQDPGDAGAAFTPTVLKVWPDRPPDEPADIGPERTRPSPKLDRKQVEVTEPTRLITAVSNPTITVHRPAADKNTGTAMLICPGGGYWDLYWELEGEEVAAWLNSIGVTGIILKYRVPRRPDEPEGLPARRPLQDAQRALRLVRGKAAQWNIDPSRIGIVGFSAGGHLAIAAATGFATRPYEPIDDLDQVSCRPDFAVAVYPGYLASKDNTELAGGLLIPTNSPPIFLAHGDEDIISAPENSVLTYLALKKAGVPAELHVYAGTTHDFGVRQSGRPSSTWTQSCADWLRHSGLLRPAEGLRLQRAGTAQNAAQTPARNVPGGARARNQRRAPERLTPLTDMTAEDRYEGEEGGLYGEGRNTPPDAHRQAAEAELARIRPLNAEGEPDDEGMIAFVAISMSNATQEFSRFKQLADASPLKSPGVVIVDCAQGGQAMAEWAPAEAPPWREAHRRLAAAKVSPLQVQTAWIKLANKGPTGSLEEHGRRLERDTLAVLLQAKRHFPNLRVAYLGSRTYGGYATGSLNPEPYAYESAFAARWLIGRQVRGDAELALARAPLLLWGPYLWAEGSRGRAIDSLVWERSDFVADGVHPGASGRKKVADLLLNFLTTDPLARTWFGAGR